MNACLEVGKPFYFQTGFEDTILRFQPSANVRPDISYFDIDYSLSDQDVLVTAGKLRARRVIDQDKKPQNRCVKVLKQGFAFTWEEVQIVIENLKHVLLMDGGPNLFHMLGGEDFSDVFVVIISWSISRQEWRVSFLGFGSFRDLGADRRWEPGTRVFYKLRPTYQPKMSRKKKKREPGKRCRRVLN